MLAELNNVFPVESNLPTVLSITDKPDSINIKSNINTTWRVNGADGSCNGCIVSIYYGLHPQKTYFKSVCLLKSIVIVAVVYGYVSYDQYGNVTSLIHG